MSKQEIQSTDGPLIYGNWGGDGCPVCGEDVNAVFGPEAVLSAPDSGEWCYKDGRFFIHEQLEWKTDTAQNRDETNGDH